MRSLEKCSWFRTSGNRLVLDRFRNSDGEVCIGYKTLTIRELIYSSEKKTNIYVFITIKLKIILTSLFLKPEPHKSKWIDLKNEYLKKEKLTRSQTQSQTKSCLNKDLATMHTAQLEQTRRTVRAGNYRISKCNDGVTTANAVVAPLYADFEIL